MPTASDPPHASPANEASSWNVAAEKVDQLLESAVAPDAGPTAEHDIRRAIVTGGSTGIGRYTAIELARSGCDVALTYAHSRDEAELTAAAIERLGRRASIHQMNTDHPETVAPVVDEMVDALGGLDVFVNNAGLMVRQRLLHLELDAMEHLFRVNVFGAAMAIQRATRHMLALKGDPEENTTSDNGHETTRWLVGGREIPPRKRPGRIIVITSVHESVASPADTAYTMSKHALGGLVKCAALELTRYNITVNAVAPGEIATPMNSADAQDATETVRPVVPVGRAGHPMEVAALVRFLASADASFMTGARYQVDGGFEAMTPLAHSDFHQYA